ncbi:hypothetical protein EV360DRAFT_77402 [Lentinula raphanica]|nr:hypothetical protein EV360DRAFT_77402 [Lentinula raphanica]
MKLTFASSLVVVVALAMMAPTQAAVLPTTNEAEVGKPTTSTLESQTPSPAATNGGDASKSNLQRLVEAFNNRVYHVTPNGDVHVHPKSVVTSEDRQGKKTSDSTTRLFATNDSEAPQKPVEDKTEDTAKFDEFMHRYGGSF